MPDRSTEIAAEQVYFDRAAEHRARRLDGLRQAPEAAANPRAASRLRGYAQAVERVAGAADEAVAFGRIDDETGERLYLGRALIRDDQGEVLVVNWQAPAAERYFLADPTDPRGLTRRRTFECRGNTIQDFTDVLFAEVGATVDRFLLQELARGRTGMMRDIVATIQAAQFEVIRAPADQLLVIEGGPGTGKTAVALHRISWLLYQHRETLSADDVLVIGPHPTFLRYIATVLPGLGNDEVVLTDITRLAPEVLRGRPEPAQVSRIKGDARMAGLLARALAARIGVPEPAERLLLDGRFVTLPGQAVAEVIAACRDAELPYAQRRHLFRQRLAQLVATRAGGSPERWETALTNLVERLWPQQSAAAFLHELYGSRNRLRAAAGGEFTEAEVTALHRRGADRVSQEIWSLADLPLLDEVEYLINGAGRRYGHVVIDEAQDLSPMQLRAVGRRSANGSLTLVGDLAQSTGPWARDDWSEVTRHLPATQPVRVTALRHGYRVPRQIYAMAQRLLPVAAPAVAPPDAVRDGPASPGVHRVTLAARAGRVAALAAEHAEAGRFVGVICPARCRREVIAALTANGLRWGSAESGELTSSINLVSPYEAKGLEFDAIVVVEPEQIVAEDERGHRLLYVALTRTTAYLDVVAVGDPLPLTVPPRREPDPDGADTAVTFTERDADRLAEHLAGQLRSAAPEESWDAVLARLRQLLGR